jgi:hypothetical protein
MLSRRILLISIFAVSAFAQQFLDLENTDTVDINSIEMVDPFGSDFSDSFKKIVTNNGF